MLKYLKKLVDLRLNKMRKTPLKKKSKSNIRKIQTELWEVVNKFKIKRCETTKKLIF